VAHTDCGVFAMVMDKKEAIKMNKITQVLRKFVIPILIAQVIIVVFFAGWLYLWIG
jgi:hypothetical protein